MWTSVGPWQQALESKKDAFGSRFGDMDGSELGQGVCSGQALYRR